MGPGNKPNILQLIAGAEPLGAMRRAYDSAGRTVLLRDMVGGALSVYAAALIARTGGTHVFVAEDRDAAAYLLNDFYALLDEKQVYFFPGSYKRSIVYGTEDAQGVVQRTAALSALRREMAAGEYRIICTYPEALAERVTDPDSMRRETVRVKGGDRLAEIWRSCWPIRGSRRWISFTNPDSIRCVAVSSTCFPFPRANLTGWTFSGKRWIRSADSRFPVSFPPTG